jgi:NAD(P)-dependent dehydrogenase (short-subunit alcohol dehydrogenase family)
MPELVAVITGGASGLGRASAERLIRDGASVVITDIRAEEVERVAGEIGAYALVQDVTDEDRWDTVMSEVEDRFGPIGALVNSAGILGPSVGSTPEHTSLADWRRIFTVNVEGTFLGCRAAIRAMRASGHGGSIVNFASIASEGTTGYLAAYGASKAAITHLTRSVAQHGGPHGIRCNSLHPGNVRTPMHERRAAELAAAQGVSPEEILALHASSSVLGGWVPEEQVAAAVAYLVSADASFVTGTRMIVDGGTLVRGAVTGIAMDVVAPE